MEAPNVVSVETISSPNNYLHLYETKFSNGARWFTASREKDFAQKIMNGTLQKTAKGVHIFAFTHDWQKVLVTKEFRYTVNQWVYAVPAGIIDPNESVISAALRELQEETGLQVSHDNVFQVDPPYMSSAGLTDEVVTNVYVLLPDEASEKLSTEFLESNELITSEFLTGQEIDELTLEGNFMSGPLVFIRNLMRVRSQS